MNHHQLTRAAELAPDCPIIALALMLKIAEMPDGEARSDTLATPSIPRERVIIAMNHAWRLGLVLFVPSGVGLSDAGKRLVEAAAKEIAA